MFFVKKKTNHQIPPYPKLCVNIVKCLGHHFILYEDQKMHWNGKIEPFRIFTQFQQNL